MFAVRLLITILLPWVICSQSHTQNLVANGNLQHRNTCIEYNLQCAPEAWFFVPQYVIQSPQEDTNHYEIIKVGNLVQRSGYGNFMYTKLLCQLRKEHTYRLSMWINSHPNAFDHLDVWMGPAEPSHINRSFRITAPAFTLISSHIDTSSGRWQRISYTFRAVGNERFLMFGNIINKAPNLSEVVSNNSKGDVLYQLDNIELLALLEEKSCPEYDAVFQQVYQQDFRHPARLIEQIPLDPSLIKKAAMPDNPRQITWVIVDTPPTLRPPQHDTITIPDILFDFNSSALNHSFTKTLDSLLGRVQFSQYQSVEIRGHTDSIGTEAYNLDLSAARALTIKEYLLKHFDVKNLRLETIGLGEATPIATNSTPQGRLRNRRVELILKKNFE